jgi:vacuolar-type H+-ATPase subunit E/Vma4
VIDRADDKPPETLRTAILADARSQAEQMLRQARGEAEELLAKAAAQADKMRQERLEAARVEAARRRTLQLARIPVEAGRRRSTRVEILLQTIHDDARTQLASGDGIDGRRALVTLAAEALGPMTGDVFVVKCSPPIARQLNGDAGVLQEIERRAGRSGLRLTVVEDATVGDGGVIVEDAEGRQVWDNRLVARLARLWPQLRRQVAIATGLTGAAATSEASRGEA